MGQTTITIPPTPATEPLLFPGGQRTRLDNGNLFPVREPTLLERWEITAMHLEMPVAFEEEEREAWEYEQRKSTKYNTEAEVNEAIAGKGGLVLETQQLTHVTTGQQFEDVITKYEFIKEGLFLRTHEKVKGERGLLPTTVTVLLRLLTTAGFWANSFEVPITPTPKSIKTLPENAAVGNGLIDTYVDLVNPLVIDPGVRAELQLFAFVPTGGTVHVGFGWKWGGANPSFDTLEEAPNNSKLTMFYRGVTRDEPWMPEGAGKESAAA